MGRGMDSANSKGRLSDSKYRNVLFWIFFVIAAFCTFFNGIVNARFANSMFDVGSIVVPISSLAGCIQALSVIFCYLMILTDYEKGIKFALLILITSFFGVSRSILVSGSGASLPGVLNCVLFALTAFFIYRQFSLSDELAITDSTTGLPNRHAFDRDLENAIRSRNGGYVVYIHVNGFHDLNANMGRKVGDQILKEISTRIVTIVKDSGTVYKIEGAEFAMILGEESDARKITQDAIDDILRPVTVKKGLLSVNCFVTADAGIADFMDKKISAEEVMLCTDVAMNYASNSEDFNVCTYNDALKQEVARVAEVEQLIKEGLENDYFYLLYQPQYMLDGKKLRGFEALVRMKLPNGSVVSPGEFIPVAEKSDLIMDIDRYVRRRAMMEFGEICRVMDNDITISVNVSAKEISNPAFTEDIKNMMYETDFPAKHLEIEITEYSLAKSLDTTIENINALRELGIKIALDDFGTGYTSLSQLLNLPVTLLKIDKTLIDNIEYSEMNRDFVKTVIYMGHLMNCDVLSEGVEGENQLTLLNEYDCDYIQGFVWNRPLEYESALKLCD